MKYLERADGFIENLSSAKQGTIWIFSLATVPLSITMGAFAAGLLLLIEPVAPANTVAELSKTGVTTGRAFSILLFAPIIENACCLIWSKIFHRWHVTGWWQKPLLIAFIAAGFHVLAFSNIRAASVFPGFFIMSLLIDNVKNRAVGYWASVLHHIMLNGVALLLAIA